MGWLIALLIIILIGLIPVGLSGRYDELGARIDLSVGPVRFPLYPSKKPKKEKVTTAGQTKENKQSAGRTGGNLSEFFPLVKTIFAFLGELIKRIKVKNLDIRVTLGGEDPCDLSVNYGRVCAAIAGLRPHIDRLFKVKKENISVDCDYTAETSAVVARVDIDISLGRFLLLLIRYGVQAIKQYFSIYNERKGGAKQ